MLMRFDPFRELDRLTQAPWGGSRPVMPMDAYRRNGDFVVHFDLPGIDPGTIDLTVEKNVLTVAAERRFAKQEGDEITVSERPQGRFSRQLFLGESLDPDRIKELSRLTKAGIGAFRDVPLPWAAEPKRRSVKAR